MPPETKFDPWGSPLGEPKDKLSSKLWYLGLLQGLCEGHVGFLTANCYSTLQADFKTDFLPLVNFIIGVF